MDGGRILSAHIPLTVALLMLIVDGQGSVVGFRFLSQFWCRFSVSSLGIGRAVPWSGRVGLGATRRPRRLGSKRCRGLRVLALMRQKLSRSRGRWQCG